MIEITRKIKERAMLVALQTRHVNRELVEEHLSELEELADTAGADSIFKIIQSISAIDSAFYIGKGKAEELAQLVELNDIDLIISDDDLTPVQVRNLDRLFNRKIIDRSGLILTSLLFVQKPRKRKLKSNLHSLNICSALRNDGGEEREKA